MVAAFGLEIGEALRGVSLTPCGGTRLVRGAAADGATCDNTSSAVRAVIASTLGCVSRTTSPGPRQPVTITLPLAFSASPMASSDSSPLRR